MASIKDAKDKVAKYFGDYDRRTLTKNERDILATMENMTLDLLREAEDSPFEKAYKYAMNVLTECISSTESKSIIAGSGDYQHHLASKAHAMRTAQRTIQVNIEMYMKHPELIEENKK